MIAVIATIIQPVIKEKNSEFQNLLDHSQPLCPRAHYARAKSRSSDWWKRQFAAASSELEIMFVSLMLLSWGSPHTIVSLQGILDDFLGKLSDNSWRHLIESIEKVLQNIHFYSVRGTLSLNVEMLSKDISKRTLVAISLRLQPEIADKIYLNHFVNYNGLDPKTLEFCQKSLLRLASNDPYYWEQALEVIEKNYSRGLVFDEYMFHVLTRDTGTMLIPIEIAEKITRNAEEYPRALVNYAEAKCKEYVASKIIAIGEIAKRDEWFSHL